jgi:Carboxypeptidase regulatory-like domain
VQSKKQGLFLLFFVVIPPCAAQNSSVQGEVTNSFTGAPIVRAHITLFNESRKYGALTNAEGKFSLQNLVPDSYQLDAERVGFKSASEKSTVLGPNELHDSVRLELTPLGAISGRVVDPSGDPMEAVNVIVERSPRSFLVENVTTDAKGRFRVGALAPGEYIVVAQKDDPPFPPEIRTDGTTEVHYASTYYPGSLTAQSGVRVEVQPGSENAGIEIKMVGVPIVAVRGRVEGIPAGDNDVTAIISDGTNSRRGSHSLAPDGSFVVWRLDPGHYSVSAEGHGPNGQELKTEPEDIDIAGSNIDNLQLRVIPPSTIRGSLVFDDDETRQRLHQTHSPEVTLSVLYDGHKELDELQSPLTAKIGEDDSFRLEGLPPNLYTVHLGGGLYVSSMRLGPSEIDGAVLDLRHGSAGEDLSLTVSSKASSVSGTVRDDKGEAAEAKVILIPDDDRGWDLSSYDASTKADGTYSLDGIAPGKYKVLVLDESANSEAAYYDGVGEEIEIKGGEKISRDFTRQRY